MAARARLTRATAATTASPSSPSSSRASSEVPANGRLKGKKRAKRADESCPKCKKTSKGPKGQDAAKDTWIGCDECSTWYHWSCVARNTLDPVDIIDKWYCPDCLKANPEYKVSYREPPRKSSRTTAKINYANLNVHMGHDPDRFITLAESKAAKIIDAFGAPPPEPPTSDSGSESDGGPPRKKRATERAKAPPGFEGFRVFKGYQLDERWLYEDSTAMTEPIVVVDEDGKALEGLDMGMPPSTIMIYDVARQVGEDVPVEVIDVASQSELSRWTLGQWAAYYEDPKRDKVRNVISLEVSETKLGKQVRLPRVVRLLDWVDNVWPEELKVEGSGAYPKVQKYCLMSVARCWTDWHVDFAGSSVFYHILKGSKTFYFIRPTPENVRKYERWSGNAEMQENVWLGDEVDHVYKVQLKAGHTMIIPTGWIHAVFTPSDSLVFGGNFLHSLNIATQLRIHEVENRTRVSKKFRFPLFLPMLWYVARHYLAKLSTSQASTPPAPLPPDVSPRILKGLGALATFLLRQNRMLDKHRNAGPDARKMAREAVPWDDIPEPKALAKELRKRVRVALGQPPERPGDETGDEEDGSGGVDDDVNYLEEVMGAKPKKKPAPPEIKPRAFAPELTKNGSLTGGPVKKDDGVIVRREVVPAKTEVTSARRVRPAVPGEVNGHVGGGEEEVEVRTTRTENTVVRKATDEQGRTVFETRTVRTIIEKVFFDPQPASVEADGDVVMQPAKGEAPA